MGWEWDEVVMSMTEGQTFATVGKERESSDITKTARRLADVLEGRQEW